MGLRIGTAVNPDLLGTNAKYTKIAAEQFSSITAETVMKWEAVEPTRGVYTWEKADQVVAFAREHKQRVRGHTLVWHNQLPKWLSSDGQTTTLSNAEVKAVLKKHVQDQVRHFKGRIWHWDVVNEAFNDDGTPRETIFYKAWGGTGYIAAAFRWAHEADPKAKLYYNDYNLEFTGPKSNAPIGTSSGWCAWASRSTASASRGTWTRSTATPTCRTTCDGSLASGCRSRSPRRTCARSPRPTKASRTSR